MKECKRFKDPIYGYIAVERSLIDNIIDTAGFQRLRNIIQTSYSPLYSSAVHNRFVHSLGVYYLGHLVAVTIQNNNSDLENIENLTRYLYVFELACLLHDLGHAPFSHTGERYYLTNGERTELHRQIIELTEDQELQKEIENRNYNAAPHELMSVIVALKKYGFLFENNEEKSFFARCIVGYPYTLKTEEKYSFLNCMISLLNSTVIDVDKLDYLIRDAYITGFETISIDYERLLTSIRLRKTENGYKLVYLKGAISVIENVVYAHDAERKWIQNHPAVQYEDYLLQIAIESIRLKYAGKNIFSLAALTEEGIKLSEEYKIKFLCDADILFLMKNLENDVAVREYLQRKDRRHPLWKSESEYKAVFRGDAISGINHIVEKALDDLCAYLNYVNKSLRKESKKVQTKKQCSSIR